MSYIIRFLKYRMSNDMQPKELGKVHFLRNYEQALERSALENKPIFLLFQEIPGCSTCQNFGASVLSDPSFVQVIENNFVPLAIHNNRGGKDSEVLKAYGEPSWNNPVVRFIDSTGKDIIKRKDGIYSLKGMARRTSEALKEGGKTVPISLEALI